MTRAREAHVFANVVNKLLGVFAIAYIVVVIGAHAAGSHGLSELAAGCPDLELCLLQGRLPCMPSSDSIETEAGERAQCGPCLPHYRQLGDRCVSETKINLQKSLLNAILKTALSDEQNQVAGRQPGHNRQKTTTRATLTFQRVNASNRSEPLPLPTVGGQQASVEEEQQAGLQHQPTCLKKTADSSTLPTARSSQYLLATKASLSDVTASPVASPHPYAHQQNSSPMAPLLRVQLQPPPAAAVMSAERVLVGRHESVVHVEAAMHDSGDVAAAAAASSAAGNKASGVDGLGKLSHLLFFVLVLSACLLTAVLLTAASVVWYRLRTRRGHLRKNRACEETERSLPAECRPLTSRLLWPRNGETLTTTTTRASPERKHRRALTVAVGDGKLAQSALRYHYERSKLQMLSSSSLSSLQHDRSTTSDNNDSSDDDNEALSGNQDPIARANTPDEEYTVYECPGLAPTSELEVHNPLFETKCHRSSSGGSNVGQS